MATLSDKLRNEGFYDYKKQCRKDLCWVRGCRNPTKSPEHSLCSKHIQRRWRSQNPSKGAYATLRDHAKKRKIKFTISHEYFEGLCDAFNFFKPEKPLEYGEYLSIDRIDPSKGYEKKNLQIMTVSENSVKGNKERYLPKHVQAILERKRQQEQDRLEAEALAEQQEEEDRNPF